jgi:hypothetical protein
MQQYKVRAKTGQIGATFAVSLLSMQQYKVRAKTGQIGATFGLSSYFILLHA